MTRRLVVGLALLLLAACARSPVARTSTGVPLNGPLVPATTTMATAWDFPQNPLTDASLGDSKLAAEIKWGFRIFINTPAEAPRFTASGMSCNNCHLNGGQRERSLPLVGIAGMFPEYNRRSGRLYTLADRVVDCFLRSENATGLTDGAPSGEHLPTTTSREVLAVAAYITWLGKGSAVGANPAWRGQNTIPAEALLPVDQIDRQKGAAIFDERCVNCHGADGQGVVVGDKKPGPLWGPASWNDGAGAARVYTLAGIIRYSMPYLDPGALTDAEALQVAAFINAQPRPVYPAKGSDYLSDKVPPDSVYYPRR